MAVTPGAVLGAAAVNSAANALTSGGTSSGGSQSSGFTNASSYSQSDAAAAREFSARQAELAYERSKELWKMQADFNSAEAQKTRDWNERLANTTYQRTIEDMIKAGINPVLAANMGLGTASISSGATATAGTPQNFMANTVAGSESASQSHGENFSSSYNESLSGLAYLADAIGNAITHMTSGMNVSIALDGLDSLFNNNKGNPEYEGTDSNGNMKEGYTKHYDSNKKKYLTETEVQNESFLQGLYRGLQNMTNARLFIR